MILPQINAEGYPNPCQPADKLNGRWCENCTAHFQITGVRYAWARLAAKPQYKRVLEYSSRYGIR